MIEINIMPQGKKKLKGFKRRVEKYSKIRKRRILKHNLIH